MLAHIHFFCLFGRSVEGQLKRSSIDSQISWLRKDNPKKRKTDQNNWNLLTPPQHKRHACFFSTRIAVILWLEARNRKKNKSHTPHTRPFPEEALKASCDHAQLRTHLFFLFFESEVFIRTIKAFVFTPLITPTRKPLRVNSCRVRRKVIIYRCDEVFS